MGGRCIRQTCCTLSFLASHWRLWSKQTRVASSRGEQTMAALQCFQHESNQVSDSRQAARWAQHKQMAHLLRVSLLQC